MACLCSSKPKLNSYHQAKIKATTCGRSELNHQQGPTPRFESTSPFTPTAASENGNNRPCRGAVEQNAAARARRRARLVAAVRAVAEVVVHCPRRQLSAALGLGARRMPRGRSGFASFPAIGARKVGNKVSSLQRYKPYTELGWVGVELGWLGWKNLGGIGLNWGGLVCVCVLEWSWGGIGVLEWSWSGVGWNWG